VQEDGPVAEAIEVGDEAMGAAAASPNPGSGPGDENRLRILRAAERLMADQGIDGVSLREINREAGQKNASAIQYHFGGRDQLLVAVLARHQARTSPRRTELLDAWEAQGEGADDVPGLAAALVVPVVERLTDPDGGRDYLQIANEFYARARSLADLGANADPTGSMARWHALVVETVPGADGPYPTRFAAVRLTMGELARRAQDPPRGDDAAFAGHLTRLVAAVLRAGSS
jgi:AcrR family transcriptional regulator